jgi:Spy/CpxP family protein refolding chaperone
MTICRASPTCWAGLTTEAAVAVRRTVYFTTKMKALLPEMNSETRQRVWGVFTAGPSYSVWRALALSLLFLLSAAPVARAQDLEAEGEARPGAETRRPGGGGELLRRLNLAPEQVRQLREIRRRGDPEARALARRLNQARRALDEAIYADSLDEAAIQRHAREVAEAQAALVRLRARTEVRVRQVLTPEQLQTFRELRQQARLEQQRRRRLLRRTPIKP